MTTAYPDLRHYTLRDYGNRVGIFRMHAGARPARHPRPPVAVNAAVAERYPSLRAGVPRATGRSSPTAWTWTTCTTAAWPSDEERRWSRSRSSILREASGQPVRGWLSPAKSESPATLGPAGRGRHRLRLRLGQRRHAVRHAHRGRRRCMRCRIRSTSTTTPSWCRTTTPRTTSATQLIDQFDLLYRESSAEGGRIMAISLHPWVIGQPYRIGGARAGAASTSCSTQGVWSATGSQILDAWKTGQG